MSASLPHRHITLHVLVRVSAAVLGGYALAWGLIAASAFALHSIAYGPAALRQVLGFDPKTIAGVGMLFAIVAGLLSAFPGDAFLTGQWLHWGEGDAAFHVGTPLVFDVGVFLVVIGAVLTIVLSLEEEDV